MVGAARTCDKCPYYLRRSGYCALFGARVADPENPPCLGLGSPQRLSDAASRQAPRTPIQPDSPPRTRPVEEAHPRPAYCPNCGVRLGGWERYCPWCGCALFRAEEFRVEVRPRAVPERGGADGSRAARVLSCLLGFLLLLASLSGTWVILDLRVTKVDYRPIDAFRLLTEAGSGPKPSEAGALMDLLQKLPSGVRDPILFFAAHLATLALSVACGFASIFSRSRSWSIATCALQFVSLVTLVAFANGLAEIATVPILGYRLVSWGFGAGAALYLVSALAYLASPSAKS